MKTCPVCDTPYPDQHTNCSVDGVALIENRELEPGHVVLGKYRVLRKLGQGGMGVVYLAEHRLLGGQLALKFLAPELSQNPQFVKRFRNEARIAYQLRHINIIEVTDLDQDGNGNLFIAMEFVEGPNLRSALQEMKGPLPVARALNIASGVAGGLAAAHARGAVHRDIKPENILLGTGPDGRELAKVLDFGIAAMSDGVSNLSRTHGLLLTPAYAAPEQWSGMPVDELDGRADLYALGGVFYEMLTGRTPFRATSDDGWMLQHLQGVAEPLGGLRPDLASEYPGLDGIVMRLLAREREQRFASAAAFLEALATKSCVHLPGTGVSFEPSVHPDSVAKSQPSVYLSALAQQSSVAAVPSELLPTHARTMRWILWTTSIVAGLGILIAVSFWNSTAPTPVPVLTPAGGTYAEGQPVAISDLTPNASIHYTVDGSPATMASPIYTKPVTSLPSGGVVRAIAAAEGHKPSSEITGVYIWSKADQPSANSLSSQSPADSLPVQPPASASSAPAPGSSSTVRPTPKSKIDHGAPAQIAVEPPEATSAEPTPEELRAKAYVMTGLARMKAQDYVSAESNFRMALNLDPDNAAAKTGLAAAKKALGD